MDIEKIGKTIKEARVSKGMTQTELSNVLLVSDKAISKWERGICCPDISLLIPISEVLNIDLYELLGNKNVDDKSLERGIKQVVKLSNNEIKNKNKKFMKKNILISSLVIILLLLACIKFAYLFRYKINNNEINSYISSQKVSINTNRESNFEYVIYEDIKFKNIIQDFDEVVNSNLDQNIKMYTYYDEKDRQTYTFSVSVNKTIISSLKENKFSIGINDATYNSINKQKFLKKNSIDSDWDLIKFLVENKNIKNDIFTLWMNIKENYYISELSEMILGNENIFSYIGGDINGYIKNLYTVGYKEAHILYGEYDYTFLFSSDYFNDDKIQELLESIIIE